jgi:hypothetical protein
MLIDGTGLVELGRRLLHLMGRRFRNWHIYRLLEMVPVELLVEMRRVVYRVVYRFMSRLACRMTMEARRR